MYNRYIPQGDGSFKRSRIQENNPPPEKPHNPHQAVPLPDRKQEQFPNCSGCIHGQACGKTIKRQGLSPKQHGNVGNFLKQLLPKNFDTEDLMIVLLLLLMAGDCQEEQNTALLTLLLYLFL